MQIHKFLQTDFIENTNGGFRQDLLTKKYIYYVIKNVIL